MPNNGRSLRAVALNMARRMTRPKFESYAAAFNPIRGV